MKKLFDLINENEYFHIKKRKLKKVGDYIKLIEEIKEPYSILNKEKLNELRSLVYEYTLNEFKQKFQEEIETIDINILIDLEYGLLERDRDILKDFFKRDFSKEKIDKSIEEYIFVTRRFNSDYKFKFKRIRDELIKRILKNTNLYKLSDHYQKSMLKAIDKVIRNN